MWLFELQANAFIALLIMSYDTNPTTSPAIQLHLSHSLDLNPGESKNHQAVTRRLHMDFV